MKQAIILFSFCAFAFGACNAERPSGDGVLDGQVIIRVEANADGVPLASAGITSSSSIEVEGVMTDLYGVKESFWSFNDSEPEPLTLGAEGGFVLGLDLNSGENELILSARSIVGDEVSELKVIYTLDNTAPTIVLPTEDFAAEISSETLMTMNKTATSFSLSGGDPVTVKDGVSFNKYSSTWGDGQPNRLRWRFNLDDEYPLDDASMEFRILREESLGVEPVIVDWTTADRGTESLFEVLVSSELNENFALLSGNYIIEVKAKDSAGNETDTSRVRWRQAIVNPPVYVATGSEDIMTSGGPSDPRTYTIGEDFSDLAITSGLEIGSAIVGNPNTIPVLARFDIEEVRSLATYRNKREVVLLERDYAAPSHVRNCDFFYNLSGRRCTAGPTNLAAEEAEPAPIVLGVNQYIFLVKDAGGAPVEINVDGSFLMRPTTSYRVILSLNSITNLMPDIIEGYFPQPGTILDESTYSISGDSFLVECAAEDTNTTSNRCQRWELYLDAKKLVQQYVTWDFEINANSKTDPDSENIEEWASADSDGAVGYTRIISASGAGFSPPTSHEDVSGL